MLQQLIIAAAVLVAAAYVIWSFMPMQRRQWLLDGLARHGVLVRWAAKHRARLATPGCGNCSAAAEHGKSTPLS
jgi:type III secretory pathway component EscT